MGGLPHLPIGECFVDFIVRGIESLTSLEGRYLKHKLLLTCLLQNRFKASVLENRYPGEPWSSKVHRGIIAIGSVGSQARTCDKTPMNMPLFVVRA